MSALTLAYLGEVYASEDPELKEKKVSMRVCARVRMCTAMIAVMKIPPHLKQVCWLAKLQAVHSYLGVNSSIEISDQLHPLRNQGFF